MPEDFSPLPKNIQARIVKAIEVRLGTNPMAYGVRLRGLLKGYWKMRVGNYRVAFSIEGKVVTIYAIKHRKDIYRVVERRIRRW